MSKREEQEAWPKTVAVGGTKVRVYRRQRADGRFVHEIADYSTGRRRLRSFDDPERALAEAQRIARLMAAGEAHAASVTGRDMASYGRALELLRPTGTPLELAVSTYTKAVEILGDDRVLEAARFFAARDPSRLPSKSVSEVVEELVALRQARGKAARYIEDLRARLKRFSDAFQVPIATVTTADVQHWLDGLKAAPQTTKNFRTVIGTLLKHAEARGYIMRGTNPVVGTERIEGTNGGAVAIYTPAEIAQLLAAAPVAFMPVLALGAFAGLRSAELERVEWSEVDLTGGFITVAADKAKTASRRIVPIAGNLASWLAPHARKSGRVWPHTPRALYSAQDQTATAAGITWKPNALRHSFASYRLALTHDAARVALEMGNSPSVVFQHYRELVRPADAEAWFTVRLEAPANIVPIAAHA